MPVRSTTAHASADTALARAAVEAGRAAGLDACGIAPAAQFEATRRILEERKAAALHGGMHFTYGDPARATNPSATVPGASAIVVGARSYHRERPPAPEGASGRVARYAWRDEYAELRAALEVVATVLRTAGWVAVVLADDNALVDREAARRAGLGWYGKNANLLLPGAGSWFVLGSVITDALLPSTGRADLEGADGCGSCVRCLPACPTGAIVGPGVIDARRCLAWLLQAKGAFPREFRRALGDRIYGCDDCQEVCPANRAAERLSPRAPAESDDEAWVALVPIVAGSAGDRIARYGRWYIPRRDPRYVRRNALVALGNVGDGLDPAVEAALQSALADADPLIRSHAVWAAHALDRDDLLGELVDDDDPEVREELALAGALA